MIEFHGGPRDGEVWEKPTPPVGRYWFDRCVVREGFGTLERCDLYELRQWPVIGWFFVTTKEGYHRP